MSNKVYTAIGLMSGTSLDGVDAALIETDGHGYVKPLGFVTMPYQTRTREEIRSCFGLKNRLDPKVKDAERLVTFKHIEAIRILLEETGRHAQDIDLIGFHGQTIYHAPMDKITVQIGDGDLMARELRIDVVDDFRIHDVKMGGEGAPLAPLYHAARVAHARVETPVAVLNIGGVANVTWIGAWDDLNDSTVLAFDTGPGNALMDDWTKKRLREPFDRDGALAAAGKALPSYLESWLSHPYFSRRPPKSLDRNEWDIAAMGQVSDGMEDVSNADGAATLQAFTIEAIIKSVEHMPAIPKQWFACGGGRHNTALMGKLGERLMTGGLGSLHNVEELGWDGDATEAECFAYLGVRSVLGLPISLPTTTGAYMPLTGGTLHKKP